MNRAMKAAALGLVCFAAGTGSAQESFSVYGFIGQKWAKLNGTAGPMGPARSSEADASDGQGRFNEFRAGYIYWRRGAPEAFAVYGEIGRKWNASGREKGLGYPTTDEMAGPNGGRYNHFDRNATIAWHRATGAHAVYGFIRDEWLKNQSGLKGNDLCGYPTTDEFQAGAYRRTNFQRGHILWRTGWTKARASCAVRLAEPVGIPVTE